MTVESTYRTFDGQPFYSEDNCIRSEHSNGINALKLIKEVCKSFDEKDIDCNKCPFWNLEKDKCEVVAKIGSYPIEWRLD